MVQVDFVDLTPIVLTHTPLGTRGSTPRIHDWQLDWKKLACLIDDNQDVMTQVEAGLAEDWLNTHGTIWDNVQGYHRYPNDRREFDDTVFWAASTWATLQSSLLFIMNSAVHSVAIGLDLIQIFIT